MLPSITLFANRSARWPAVILLSAAAASVLLSSPKWGIAFFAWLQPVCLLFFFRQTGIRRKAMWAFPALMLGHYLADRGGAPFPLPVLLVMCVIQSLEQLAIYATDAWVMRRADRFVFTLFFPSIAVALEYGNTRLGGGIWWSVANTQYHLVWLIQLAAVTGVWGISFLLYWTASVVVRTVSKGTIGKERGPAGIGEGRRSAAIASGLGIYGGVLALVLGWGYWRYTADGTVRDQYTGDGAVRDQTVRVGGVTVPLLDLLATFYRDYSGHPITLDPKASVTDPALRQVSQAEASYIESADLVRYKDVVTAIRGVNDSLFALSQQAVNKGARIVCWSEGNAVVWKSEEGDLLQRGRCFAARNEVYLLMAFLVVHPGKITPGTAFLENEAALIGPDGSLLTRFYKNNPVPMVEASRPGDGTIPVVQTPMGRLAVSICYDADFPLQMRQLDHKDAGLLLLPSGDWYAISPFHTYMAVYRAIENGCSLFREVNNGLSIAADYRGKPAGSRDYFRDGRRLWLADLPVRHVDTIYGRIGDVLPFGCLLFMLVTMGLVIAGRVPGGLHT